MSKQVSPKKMNKYVERLYNGIIKENPTFVLMLGMCPTLAVTTSAKNGLSMGLATAAVLIMSNMIISALRKVIPDKVRMPAYIVVVATFVTILQYLLEDLTNVEISGDTNQEINKIEYDSKKIEK